MENILSQRYDFIKNKIKEKKDDKYTPFFKSDVLVFGDGSKRKNNSGTKKT